MNNTLEEKGRIKSYHKTTAWEQDLRCGREQTQMHTTFLQPVYEHEAHGAPDVLVRSKPKTHAKDEKEQNCEVSTIASSMLLLGLECRLLCHLAVYGALQEQGEPHRRARLALLLACACWPSREPALFRLLGSKRRYLGALS